MTDTFSRILAISDIHGMYNHFKLLLKLINYNPSQDKLILVGDYVDRGQKSKQVIEQVIELTNNGAIALRGNHDQMFLDWLTTNDGMNEFNFMRNGGLQTIESYCGYNWFESGKTLLDAKKFILDNFPHHVKFLNELPYYHETKEYIFVHAGINPFYNDWLHTSHEEMLWIRDMFHHNDTNIDKTVIFGHTPCVNLHSSPDVWFAGDKIGIDGGCAYGYQLNCLEIKDGCFTQFHVKSKEISEEALV